MIGNRYYTGSIQNYKISDVSNASNDSSDVTYVLRQCGFQVVHGTDVGKNKFFQLLNNFVTATKSSAQQITKQQRREKRKEKGKGIYLSGLDLNDKDQEDNTSLVLNELNLEEEDINKKSTEPVKTIMFFYFSGHGLQVDGVNYLVPVNAVINSIDDVPKQCFNLNTLFESLKEVPNNFTNIIILDCCRNNPSPNNSIITKPGLAVIDDSVFTTSHGSLILFATQSGRYASDGIENQNGVFTKHLLAALTNPSLKVGDFKEHIAAEMAKDPNNTTNQRPTAISAGLLNISLHS